MKVSERKHPWNARCIAEEWVRLAGDYNRAAGLGDKAAEAEARTRLFLFTTGRAAADLLYHVRGTLKMLDDLGAGVPCSPYESVTSAEGGGS